MKSTLALVGLGILACGSAPSVVAGGKEPVVPVAAAVEPAADRPLPIGVGLFYSYQKQDYQVKDLEADLPELAPPKITELPPGTIPPGLPPPMAAMLTRKALAAAQQIADAAFAEQMAQLPTFGPDSIRSITNEVSQVSAKLDWWVLPCLNLHALYGQLEGTAEATLSPELERVFGNLAVDYDGLSYGGGVTVAGGWRRLFAMVEVDYTWADADLEDTKDLKLDDPDGIGTLVVIPKIGCRIGDVSVWVGAQYQHSEHKQTGAFTLDPLGKVPFGVEVEDEHNWGWLAGVQWDLNRHWSLTAEAGLATASRPSSASPAGSEHQLSVISYGLLVVRDAVGAAAAEMQGSEVRDEWR